MVVMNLMLELAALGWVVGRRRVGYVLWLERVASTETPRIVLLYIRRDRAGRERSVQPTTL